MIRNVIFDMGQVLVCLDINRYLERFADTLADRELLRREVLRSVEWVQLDRGSITDQEAVCQICRRLPERLHGAVGGILDRWHEDIQAPDEIYDLARDLKSAGYGLYLLSNTSARFHRFRKNIPTLEFFDGELISADCGLLKPQPEIYRLFLKTFSLEPETCVFIDDTPANIEGALTANIQGIVYNNDPRELRRKLQALGVDC